MARVLRSSAFVVIAVASACASREGKQDLARQGPDGGYDGGVTGGASGGVPQGGTVSGGGAASNSAGGTSGNGGSANGGSATGGEAGSRAASGGSGSDGTAGNTGGAGTVNGSAFTTDFNLTESPISEEGAWQQLGLDWTRVVTANGLAFGTQSGSAGFDDSYAVLTESFPADQSATAIIHIEPGVPRYAEVEILLRWRDTEHTATGYECNLAFNGEYAEIVRWPGPRGTDISQYTYVARSSAPEGVSDGDVFQADVIGNVITVRLNGRVLVTGTDTAIPDGGAPGIGFYWDGSPASQKYSFTRFSATGL